MGRGGDMKGPTWERLTRKYILPDLPDWAVKGRLMFRVPIGAMLQATLLDGSIDPNGGYLHVFVQPLFVPSDTIVIDYGMRLRHDRNEYWPISADAPEAGVRAVGRALRTDALP